MDLIVLVMFSIPLIAQLYVTSTYNKYVKVDSKCDLSGYDMAKKILDKNGLGSLYIVETQGTMSDHYDPTRKVVKLSRDVYHKTSVASIAIAAHECGHAIQDKDSYLFLRVRSRIVPVVNLGTKMAYLFLVLGGILEMIDLIHVGIFLVGFGLIFQLVTLPVEIDASARALEQMKSLGVLKSDTDGVKVMLKAAAFTYVAAVISSALNVFRLTSIYTGKR